MLLIILIDNPCNKNLDKTIKITNVCIFNLEYIIDIETEYEMFTC